MKLSRLIKKIDFFIAFIILVEIVLFFTNYKPGTYLVGWDNLLPELNFPANLERSFFSVWQEYRGLGLLDGMSFAANLPHYLFIYLTSFFLPQNMLRYFFIFLMHLLGGLGMYKLLSQSLLTKQPNANNLTRNFTSLIGAFFYLFNLDTVQIFYAPYELFTVHFAFLPWLTFYLMSYLNAARIKSLILFSLFSLLAIPQAHVPTIFLVYLILISVCLLHHLLTNGIKSWKKVVSVGIILFFINSFWLMPFLYSAFYNSRNIMDSKINQMTNEVVFLKNKARGNISDILLLKGFLYDETEVLKTNQTGFIMSNLRDHSQTLGFKIASEFFLLLTIIGFLRSFFNRQKEIIFSTTLIICFAFLATNILILDSFTAFLRSQSPLFREIFRFSFTKFAILFSFCYSILLALGIDQTINLLTKLKFKKFPVLIFCIVITTLVGVYSIYLFSGNFLYDSLRLPIPSDYFKTIEFFQKQNNDERVALLPQPTFWSWRFYNWGARGSGFLWYGIKQPTLDLAFDPWSNKNENYYWEMSYALYSNNPYLFQKVMDKYQISWILLDRNTTYPTSPTALYFSQTENLLSKLERAKLVEKFGAIEIYHLEPNRLQKNFISIDQSIPNINPEYSWNNYDPAYANNGDYYSSLDNISTSNNYYPFRSLFGNKEISQQEFSVEENNQNLIFKKQVPNLPQLQLKIPSDNSNYLVWVNQDELSQTGYYLPQVNFDGQILKVTVPKIGGYFSSLIDPTTNTPSGNPKSCNQTDDQGSNSSNSDSAHTQTLNDLGTKYLRLESRSNADCQIAYWLPTLTHKSGYLISITSRNIKGRRLYFWLENVTNKHAEIETYLPNNQTINTSYFIQPPMEQDGLGYTIHFVNSAYGNDDSINDLLKISIAPIPYYFLTDINFSLSQPNNSTSLQNFVVSHPNPSWYQVQINGIKTPNDQKTLILSQSFDSGWQAFTLSGLKLEKLPSHVLINNWENGWALPADSLGKTIYIIFLPQLLEFFGFLILAAQIIILIYLYIRKQRKIET